MSPARVRRSPLQAVDAVGLRGRFIDGEREATVLQFLIDVDRGRGQEDHHRPLDMVFLRHHPARVRVFAGGRDGEFAFALQQLQRVAGFLRTGFLDDREDFMLEVGFAEVVQGSGRSWRCI